MKIATNQERLNELFDSDPRNDTAIALALGVSKQTISMWRHGTRSPKKSVLVQIAKEFDVSIEWLMGFDVERSGQPKQERVPIVVPDSARFVKLVKYMSEAEYQMVMTAFANAEKKLREAEGHD